MSWSQPFCPWQGPALEGLFNQAMDKVGNEHMPAAVRAAEDPACRISEMPAQSPDMSPRERGPAVSRANAPSAGVDFVLVGALLRLFFLAVIQLTLVLHVRNTLIDAAASGARYGTLADRNADEARDRTGELIGLALNAAFARGVTISEVTYPGIRTVERGTPCSGLQGPRTACQRHVTASV